MYAIYTLYIVFLYQLRETPVRSTENSKRCAAAASDDDAPLDEFMDNFVSEVRANDLRQSSKVLYNIMSSLN